MPFYLRALLVSALLGMPAAADQITLTATKDNTLYEDPAGLLSNGAGDGFFVGRTGQSDMSRRRGLIAFNTSAIPAGSTVTQVTVRLYMSRTIAGPTNVSVHRALADWGEGASVAAGQGGAGGPASTGDATWIHRFFNTVTWTTPGGDYAPQASATVAVDGNGSYAWTSGGLVSDVQAWVDSPTSNFGWVVRGDESAPSTAKRFATRESNQSSRRPRLEITFTPPGGTGACCFSNGTCQILTAAQCAAQGGTYQGDGTPCSPNPCPQPTGACCLPGSTCMVLTAAQCTAMSGAYQGDGTTCSPNPCAALTGACCFNNASCQVLTETQCTGGGGTFLGVGTACSPALCPLVLEPFVDALPLPAVAQPVTGVPGGAASYEITMTEFDQQLHRDLPPTRVWGYEGTFPGPTIEAFRDAPVTVTWINDLRDDQGVLRTAHYLPVDTCLHGPNVHGAAPRTVVHLHGGHVAQDSDGYPEATFLPGEQSAPYLYPNAQLPTTMWFHDHALGITRLNVYMGLAGFYLLRDDFENQLGLPAGEHELPLAIQDRSFHPDGTLKYPAQWEEDFFGDVMLVNGKVWPFVDVKRGKYRVRLLNGCTSRSLVLSLSDGAPLTLIGGDGGLLEEPVSLTEVTLSPGERADVIVDFEGYAAGTEIVLTNSAPAPFPGTAGVGVVPDVLKFIVGSSTGHTDPVPATLRPLTRLLETSATLSRDFTLQKVAEPCAGSYWLINGLGWDDITEFPRLDTTEVWSFINRSGIVHPMHLHLVMFQVLDRQAFDVVGGQVVPTGPRIPPPPEEAGWKDTVRCNPQEITRVIARFESYTGLYAYHCHILEHEDHEMMRQFRSVCYPDCNGDQAYNLADFGCFQTQFALGDPYADCNGDGQLNLADFGCFQTKFALGCP